MRILGNLATDLEPRNKQNLSVENEGLVKQGNTNKELQKSENKRNQAINTIEKDEGVKGKLEEIVNKMNEMLEITNNTSKFMFHDGLERYYITVVNRDTDEVVKEIPPKKLLDAFYEMQKMLGMIVDEKI